MDVNTLRISVTVIGFLCFVAICVWAYSKRAKKGFEEAANLPFTEEDDAAGAPRSSEKGKDNG